MQKTLLIFAIANSTMGFPVSMCSAAVHEMCLKSVFYVMLSYPHLLLSVISHHSECSMKPRNDLLNSITYLLGTKYTSSGT